MAVMTSRRGWHGNRVFRFLATGAGAVVLVLTLVTPAGAHTSFTSSDPPDGSVVEGSVDALTLVFSGPAEPTGPGFEALDASGELRVPSESVSTDGLTWVLRFEPPLSEGQVGVRWTVKAPDAHPIDGSFSFTIEATPTPVDRPEPITSPPAEPSDPELDAGPAARDRAVSKVTTSDEANASATLEEFLETEDPGVAADRVGTAGRLLATAGTLFALGAMLFAAFALRDDRRDVSVVLRWIGSAGWVTVAGAVAQLMAQVVLESGGAWSALSSSSAVAEVTTSSFGIAAGLRVVGGLTLGIGALRLPQRAGAKVAALDKTHAAVGVGAPGPDLGPPVLASVVDRSDPTDRQSPLNAALMAGAVALVAAHLFDGHTVVKGHRFWTGLADVVHVLAGAVWAGGVITLALVLWHRQRQGRKPGALPLAVRFSVMASVALVGVAIAGIVLTVIVLDSPSELWQTEWGRVLLVKIGLVGLASTAGAYNHRVLMPEMAAVSDGHWRVARFRAVVTIEAAILLAVVVATAFLVGAAS